MAKNKKVKKGFYKYISVTVDIFIYPILLLAVFTSFIMINAKRDNEIYSFFGYSIVKILSGSMVADGFNKDDLVILHREDTDTLWVGDNIAFYQYWDTADPRENQLEEITDLNNLPEITSEESVCGTKTKKDASKAGKRIIFHKIKAVYQAADGTRFFQTYGVSNSYIDSVLIREDFVLGKGVHTPKTLMNIFSFCSSSKGMIILVIIPLSVLIFLQLLEIFEIINLLLIEKKVLNLEIRYNSKITYDQDIGGDMRFSDQAYFYDIVPLEDKTEVKNFLWGGLVDSKKKRHIRKLALVDSALAEYETNGQLGFWNTFINNIKRRRLKRFFVKRSRQALTLKKTRDEQKAIEKYKTVKTYEQINADAKQAKIDKKKQAKLDKVDKKNKNQQAKQQKQQDKKQQQLQKQQTKEQSKAVQEEKKNQKQSLIAEKKNKKEEIKKEEPKQLQTAQAKQKNDKPQEKPAIDTVIQKSQPKQKSVKPVTDDKNKKSLEQEPKQKVVTNNPKKQVKNQVEIKNITKENKILKQVSTKTNDKKEVDKAKQTLQETPLPPKKTNK